LTSKNHNVTLRQRPYRLLETETAGPTTTDRATVLTPTPGFRIRIVKVRILQTAGEGRFLVEVYFSTQPNIIFDASKGIDILAVPNIGSDSTRTFARNEGPRGLRGEVVSVRNRGVAPSTPHRVFIEYTEEA